VSRRSAEGATSAVPTCSSKSLREYSLRVRVRCLDRHLAEIVGTALGHGGYQRSGSGNHEVKLEKRKSKNEQGLKTRWLCRDPSAPRPDAPKCGAEEKIGPLRSG